jgi:hypothetical protein
MLCAAIAGKSIGGEVETGFGNSPMFNEGFGASLVRPVGRMPLQEA